MNGPSGGAAGAAGAGSSGGAAADRLLRQIIEAMSADLDLDGIVGRVADLVAEATGSDVCFVHLLDEHRQVLTLAGATPPFDALAGQVELAVGEGVAGWVAEHGEPAVVQDKWSDWRYRYIPALRGEDFATMVSVPMVRRGGSLVGVLNVHTREHREISEDDLALFCDVASLLAGMVDNAILRTRLAEREESLERFAAAVIEAQETERRRLAGDIHDGVSQRLVGIFFHLAAASDAIADDSTRLEAQLQQAMSLTTAALEETRQAIAGLRPAVLDDLGLGAGLESLARALPGVEWEVVLEPPGNRLGLEPHVETALYRIAQEALQNVTKHAGATRVRVELGSVPWAAPVAGTTTGAASSEQGAGGPSPCVVRLVVVDDGRGFDMTAISGDGSGRTYGLASMRERAELIGASLHVDSSPGDGTRITVVLPRL